MSTSITINTVVPVNIADALGILPTSIVGMVGQPIAPVQLATAGGFTGPNVVTTFAIANLPPGLSCTPQGLISGTPELPFTGNLQLQITQSIG